MREINLLISKKLYIGQQTEVILTPSLSWCLSHQMWTPKLSIKWLNISNFCSANAANDLFTITQKQKPMLLSSIILSIIQYFLYSILCYCSYYYSYYYYYYYCYCYYCYSYYCFGCCTVDLKTLKDLYFVVFHKQNSL